MGIHKRSITLKHIGGIIIATTEQTQNEQGGMVRQTECAEIRKGDL